MLQDIRDFLTSPVSIQYAWVNKEVSQNSHPLYGGMRVWETHANDKTYYIGSELTTRGFVRLCPFIAPVEGAIRMLASLVYTIVHLIAALFNNRDSNLKEASFGAQQIGIGLIAMIPFGSLLILHLLEGNDMDRCKEMIVRENNLEPDKVYKITGEERMSMARDAFFVTTKGVSFKNAHIRLVDNALSYSFV